MKATFQTISKKTFSLLLPAFLYCYSLPAKSNINDIVVGIGYTHLLLNESQFDETISVGAISGSLGYQFNYEYFYIMPEVRAAFGLVDANWQSEVNGQNADWTLELDSYGAFAIKFGMRSDYAYLYLSTAINKIDALPKSRFLEVSSDAHDGSVSMGVGAGLSLGPWFSIDFTAEYLDMGSIYGSSHLRIHLPVI